MTARSVKDKDGFCPIVKQPRVCSSVKCSADSDCSGMKKCCDVPGCDKTCQEPSFTSMSIHNIFQISNIEMSRHSETYCSQFLSKVIE